MSAKLLSAAAVDAGSLETFLNRSFSPVKAEFLLRHGAWQHREEDCQLVLVEGDEIVGYCGVIPVECRIEGKIHDAVWWVDLIIDRSRRGRGLQTIFDDRVRSLSRVKLGFPNALAAKIHRKHGWGVREDYETLLLPLRPRQLNPVLRSTGFKSRALRAAAVLAEPMARRTRRRLERYAPREVQRLETLDVDALAELFERRHPVHLTTIQRDPGYLAWRYRESPHRRQLSVYTAGGELAAVVRTVEAGDRRLVRVLDLFGNLDRHELLIDLLTTIGRDAVRAGAIQATLFASLPVVGRAGRAAGFRLPGEGRFCWYSDRAPIHQAITNTPHYWVLGDSDHDEPV